MLVTHQNLAKVLKPQLHMQSQANSATPMKMSFGFELVSTRRFNLAQKTLTLTCSNTITDERKATVSFSDPYYSTNQAVVGFADSPVASATKLSELKELKFGAQSGTTSLDFINNVIQPTNEPFVYDDNAGAKAALEAKQIDAIVVDLPTAFYISAVEIEGSKVIGQFPLSDAVAADNFGLLFDKDNKLVDCVNTALGALKESGKLAEIEKTWLADKTNAPVITLD